MDVQVIVSHALFFTVPFDQLSGQCRFSPVGYHPADKIPAVPVP
jgi:hypothetical protein